MLRMNIENPNVFNNLLRALVVINQEMTFQTVLDFDARNFEGIRARAMDPSRVAMVDFELPKQFFEEWECNKDTRIKIDLRQLLRLLSRASGKDKVEITFSPTLTKGRWEIKIMHELNVRKFSMPILTLVEDEDEVPPVPKLTFNATAKLLSDLMKQVLEDVALVSNRVWFEADSDKLVLDAHGDLMTANIELEKTVQLLLLEVNEPSKALYSLNYLINMVKAGNMVADIATVQFSKDMPMKLMFEMKTGNLTYYMAPRIEELT